MQLSKGEEREGERGRGSDEERRLLVNKTYTTYLKMILNGREMRD